MTSTVDDWKVVYLRLITSELGNDIDIIELAARFEEEEFSKWITPSIKKLWNHSRLAKTGFKIENGALFRNGQRLETIDLKTALMAFHQFVTSLPGPVLLVTHSSRSDMMLLFEAIQRTDMVDAFRGIIDRVTNTLPIFTKVYSKLVTTYPLTLDLLIKSVLKISTHGKYLESQFYLECLAELIFISSISTAELIENSESYEEVFLSVSRSSRSWVSTNQKVLRRSIHPDSEQKLGKSYASYATLKNLSRKHDYTKFHEYLDKQYVTNIGCKINPIHSKAIFRTFNEINEREDEDHVSTSDLVELNAAGPSRIPDASARYSNDHSANREQQNVGSDVTISLVDDVEVPRYDKSYPFNKQQGELNAAGPSRKRRGSGSTPSIERKMPARALPHSSIREYVPDTPARYNDYPPARGRQQHHPHGIYSLVDELPMEYNTNYSSIRDQEELGHNMEIQGPSYDNTYQFTEERNVLINEPASIMWREEPCNNDYSLTRGQQQELPYGVHSLVEELETEYDANYSPIREQEELVRDMEIQGPLYDNTYQFTGERNVLINEPASIMGREEPCNNDYSLTRGQQQELPYGVHSLVEELATEYDVNYSPIREQEELVHDIERQEALYSNDYPSTRHQEERNADARSRSSMGEWYFPINQDQRDQEFDPFYWRNYQQK